MDNSVKAILIGASVVITLIIVTLGFFILRQGQATVSLASNQISNLNSNLSESGYTMYDEVTVSGSEVVNAIKKFKDEHVGIKVTTNKTYPSGDWYINDVDVDSSDVGEIDGGSSNSISDTIDETKDEYINPNGKFLGEVIRDKNGVVVALRFVQK